jgi:mannose-6-phosphate isomerase
MDWRPVAAGDFIFVPSGTIHAIGAGIALLEFQQNADVTYRLYDYGRPRELHLDDGVAVAAARRFDEALIQHLWGTEQRTLVDGPHFTLVLSSDDALQGRQRWVMPLDGDVHCVEVSAGPGDCLLVGPNERVESSSARLLIGAKAQLS